MNNQYNVWCKWHPLRTVMLGDCYPASFFKDIKNDKIRSSLTRIADETSEDLAYFESVLKSYGCTVLKPVINKNLSIMNFCQDNSLEKIPRAPLQPRDYQFVLGNKLYYHGNDSNGEILTVLEQYNKTNIDHYYDLDLDPKIKISKEHFNIYVGTDWLTYDDYLKDDYFDRVNPFVKEELKKISSYVGLPAAPSCTLVGRDLYVDIENKTVKEGVFNYYQKHHPYLRINSLNIGGHNDGCFHTIKQGAILSLFDIQKYDQTFPEWDVCYLPNQSWELVAPFLEMKRKVNGKWWVPGEEDNDEFTYFVETWLNNWVGYCEESVFDVNVLMLDEHHVCVNNYNETAFAFFKKHNIEPIIVPWRHRFFWDGGLHCITLDLYREGQMEDYFPNRKEGVIDLGF